MTVSNETSVFTHNGNDVATSFAFTLKCFAAGDIVLTLVDTLDADTVLVLDTDYSIVLNANQNTNPGGTITYPLAGTPLATGEKLLGEYQLAYTQSTDIANTGFYPEDAETMADRNTILLKRLRRLVDRCIKIPSSKLASTTTLLAKEDITNKVIRGKADGTGFELVTMAEATITDGSITTTKLGGDITTFSKLMLTQISASGWMSALTFSTYFKTLVTAANSAALRTLLDVSALGSTVMSVASASALRVAAGATTLGESLITAANEAAVRTAAGITSAGSTIVTTATANGASFVTAANYAAQKVLWGVTAKGDELLTAVDAAAVRTAAGNSTIGSNIAIAADAAAVRALLSVGTDIPAGGVIQTVFAETVPAVIRVQGITNKIIIHASILYTGNPAGTFAITVSDEGATATTLNTIGVNTTGSTTDEATLVYEYTPGVVALHDLTFGIVTTGITVTDYHIHVTEVKGGFVSVARPWSPADLGATNPEVYKTGLSLSSTAVNRGGTSTPYALASVGTWFNRAAASDFECATTDWNVLVDAASPSGFSIGGVSKLESEATHTGEFTLAYRFRVAASFTGNVRFSAGYSANWVDSGSELRRGFVIRDSGLIDFGLDQLVGNTATYDATALDWSVMHNVVLRRTAGGGFYLYIDGAQVGSLLGAAVGAGPYQAADNASIERATATATPWIFSAYLSSTDVGAGADFTLLNTWLSLAE